MSKNVGKRPELHLHLILFIYLFYLLFLSYYTSHTVIWEEKRRGKMMLKIP